MKKILAIVMVNLFLLVPVSISIGAEEEFDSQKLLSDLEKKLELSSEEFAKLKPEIDAKSKDLQKSINESIDRGFLELEKMSGKLDEATKETEKRVKEFLSSEEYRQFKETLNKVDKQAIEDAKTKLVEEMSSLLELTEAQAEKMKPILEESVTELGEMVDQLKDQGIKGVEEFKREYERMVDDLREKYEQVLEPDQLDKFEKYNEERKQEIGKGLMEV